MATIPQRSACDPWAIQVIDTQTFRHPTPNHVVAITRVFLVDPASAAGQGDVCACIKIGTLRYMLASLSAERPCTELLDPFVLDQDFTLYVPGGDDRSDEFIFIIQVEGYQYHGQECDEDEAKEDEESSEEEEEVEEDEDSSDEEEKVDGTTSEDDDESDKEDEQEEDEDNSEEEEDENDDISEDEVDSDAEDKDYSTEEEEEESHGMVNRPAALACRYGYDDRMLQQSNFVPGGQFVGGPAPRFASAGSTAGLMRVVYIDSQEGDNSNKQISVLYRCTHFLGASGGGLRVREGTTMHQLQFIVPPAGDMARSLLCVSASLTSLLYPIRFHKRLQRLWSSLIAEVSVPTRASQVDVLVDFGILRTADRTTKRMDQMRAALEGMVREDFHPEVHLQLQLPQPAQCGAGEDCAVCWDLLEGDDLAVWPGCSKPHVFHGTCLELILKRSDNRCPICRSFWAIETKPLNIRNVKDESGDNQVDG